MRLAALPNFHNSIGAQGDDNRLALETLHAATIADEGDRPPLRKLKHRVLRYPIGRLAHAGDAPFLDEDAKATRGGGEGMLSWGWGDRQ